MVRPKSWPRETASRARIAGCDPRARFPTFAWRSAMTRPRHAERGLPRRRSVNPTLGDEGGVGIAGVPGLRRTRISGVARRARDARSRAHDGPNARRQADERAARRSRARLLRGPLIAAHAIVELTTRSTSSGRAIVARAWPAEATRARLSAHRPVWRPQGIAVAARAVATRCRACLQRRATRNATARAPRRIGPRDSSTSRGAGSPTAAAPRRVTVLTRRADPTAMLARLAAASRQIRRPAQ